MAKLGLTSPWVTFYHEVNAFFEKDSDIRVIYDEEENVISLYVDNEAKAAALTELLPTEKVFGAVTVYIKVIPANRLNVNRINKLMAGNENKGDLVATALEGNGRLSDVVRIVGIFNNPMTYIVFRKEVVQYFNDSLGDINGVCSTLMQDIAKDIFEDMEGVYFCTDIKDPFSSITVSADNIFSTLCKK